MVDLKWLLKCMDCIPVFVVKLGTRDRVCWIKRVVISVFAVLVIIITLKELSEIKTNSIESFIAVPQTSTVIIPVSSYLWYAWFSENHEKVTIQDFYSFDQKFQTGTKTFVGVLISLAVSLQLIVWGILLFQVIYIFNLSAYLSFKHATVAVVFGFPIQVWLIKHMLCKRLKVIRTWIEEGEDPLNRVVLIRELIDLNIRVNTFFSSIVTGSLVFNLTAVLRNVAGLWMFFRLHKESHDITVGIFLGLSNLQLLWMVLECYEATGLLNDLQWEIDRVISNRRNPLNRRKQLMVFLQELHHSPAVFTCMDFFTAEPSSVTVLCSLVLNALMVFIQFMHQ